jgi:ABC-type bacteriocin/lantibiotic exporter with double-glycine peptidase domain
MKKSAKISFIIAVMFTITFYVVLYFISWKLCLLCLFGFLSILFLIIGNQCMKDENDASHADSWDFPSEEKNEQK